MTETERLHRRNLMNNGRCVITATNDAGGVHKVQVRATPRELIDDVPVVQIFGLSSHAPVGSEAHMVCTRGDRSSTVVVATNNPDARPRNLNSGEVALFDNSGSILKLENGGNVSLTASGTHTITVPLVHVEGRQTMAYDPVQPTEVVTKSYCDANRGEGGGGGAPGPEGPPGPAGPAGPAGETGAAGPAGSVGPQGPQGVAGATGGTGPAGPPGADSTVPGPQGPQGITGAQGAKGDTGDAGATGAQGPAGPAGADSTVPGPQGPQGATGAAGPQGVAGATGAQGPIGLTGATGAQGPQGVAGADSIVPGPAGPTGATGAAGVTGAQGPQGVAGATGATGSAGADSTVPGPAGPAGATGAQGPAGPTGATGPQGAPGTSFPDAPNDTSSYGRSAAAWARVPSLFSLGNVNFDLNTVPRGTIGLYQITNQTTPGNFPPGTNCGFMLAGFNSNGSWINQLFMGPGQGDLAPIWYRASAGATQQRWCKLITDAGGTLQAPLILAADPTTALGAATKQYVDNAIAALPQPIGASQWDVGLTTVREASVLDEMRATIAALTARIATLESRA